MTTHNNFASVNDEEKKHLLIIKEASWLSMFNNRRITALEVLDRINKWGNRENVTIEEIVECLDYYLTIGGCDRLTQGDSKTYHFMPDLDDDKRLVFPDGHTFFYAKDRGTFNDWKQALYQQIKEKHPLDYHRCLLT